MNETAMNENETGVHYYVIGEMAYGRGSTPAEAIRNFDRVVARDFRRMTAADRLAVRPPIAWRSPAEADGFVYGYFGDGGCPVMWTRDGRNVRRAVEADIVELGAGPKVG